MELAAQQVLAGVVVAAIALTYALGPGFRAQRVYGLRFSHAPTWWDGRVATTILTLVAIVIACATLWGSADLVLALPLVVFGPTLALTDIAVHRLPNAITTAFAVLSVVVLITAVILDSDSSRILRAVCAAGFFGLVFLLSNFVRGGFGMGDVKLAPSVFGLAAAHSLMGLGVMVGVTFVGAGLYALVLVATHRAKMSSPLALGPWLMLGLLAGLAIG